MSLSRVTLFRLSTNSLDKPFTFIAEAESTTKLSLKYSTVPSWTKNSSKLPSFFALLLFQVLKELLLKYDLPKYLLGKLWKGKYRGQKQKWFVMKFLGKLDEINIKTKNPEFLDWKWIELSKLPNVAVHFKVDIYKKIKGELTSLNLN